MFSFLFSLWVDLVHYFVDQAMRFRFTLAKLISGSTKESQKQKRSNGKAEIEKEGTIVSGGVPPSIRGIAEVVSREFAIDPGVDIMVKRAMVTLIAPMGIGVTEVTLAVASPITPIIPKEGEVQVAKPMVFVMPRELVIIEVAR